MRKFPTVLVIFVAGMVLAVSGAAFAYDFGTNITIWDKVVKDNPYTWYNRGNPGEDQEVEPNCITGQLWDLEAFFLNGSILTMVGGFDFRNGYRDVVSGDIFLDVNRDFVYGEDIEPRTSSGIVDVSNEGYRYEYAIRLFVEPPGMAPASAADVFTYQVLSLGKDTLLSVYYGQNDESNPWKVKEYGTPIFTGTFTYMTGLTDDDTGLAGGSHNALQLDLAGFLAAQELANFTAHFTMQCGNDNLMGSPVSEPATMLLVGTGLIGMAAVGRRKFLKRA